MSAMPLKEPDGSERRVAPRTRTLKRAKIFFNNNFSTFDCVVRNISSTGALLTIDEAAHLPKEFDVRIGEEETRPAKLVYRRGVLAGIRFLDIDFDDEPPSRAPNVSSVAVSSPASPGEGTAGSIRRIEPEALPAALLRHLRWTV